MPMFCDAYLGDTKHLTLEEHGAYLLLLMVTWRNNGVPLPDDDQRIARILGITPHRWRSRIRPVVITFFDVSSGNLVQKRLKKEWEVVAKHARIARKNGERGGRPNALNGQDTENPAGFENGLDSRARPSQSHTQESLSSKGEGLEAPAAPAPAREAIPEPNKPKPNGYYRAMERQRRRDLLLQKLFRFVAATMTGDEATAAGLGLMADDKAEAQRWLDKLDRAMRLARWDDVSDA